MLKLVLAITVLWLALCVLFAVLLGKAIRRHGGEDDDA